MGRIGVASTPAERFYVWLTRRPGLVIVVTLACLGALLSFMGSLTQDTRPKGQVSAQNPSILAIEEIEEIFGVNDEDMMIVAVLNEGPNGVFNPNTLNLIRWLTNEIEQIPGVDPQRVTSLTTEKNIRGTADGMLVEPFYEGTVTSAAHAAEIQRAVGQFELYLDGLVSRDGRAAVVLAKLLKPEAGRHAYQQIMQLLGRAPIAGEEVHVAGLGAYNSLLGDYIDRDAARLNPIASLIILGIMFAAYRTLRSLFVAIIAIAGSLVAAFGAMAAFGVPVYSITASMSVILIAISVCDVIHILGQYYTEQAEDPTATSSELVIRAMQKMLRPVFITTATTMAGFVALSVAFDLPPMRWYGIFAAVGVAAAFLLSAVTIPAVLTLLPAKPSPALTRDNRLADEIAPDRFGAAVAGLGRAVYRRPEAVLLCWAGLGGLAVIGALQLEQDNDFKLYLDPSEPLYIAEDAINETLGGIQSLNILVETARPEQLYEPRRLEEIEALQGYLASLPHVRSTKSLVDYVKQMHRAMNEDDPGHFAIPDDSDLIAQYFLLYETSGDPTDFEEVVDSAFQRANLHVAFDRARWSDARAIIPSIEGFIERHVDSSELKTKLSGLVHLAYVLDRDIARGQLIGVPLSFLAVWLVTVLSFRSPVAGTLAILPVAFAMLVVYGVMGFSAIWLNFATAMTGAIAIGVSVDFSVHTLDRIIELTGVEGNDLEEAFAKLFPSTGRALLFNFMAIFLGFGVLILSVVPSLREFGVLVCVCVGTSFLSSLTLLPALVKMLEPRCVMAKVNELPTRALSGRPESESRATG